MKAIFWDWTGTLADESEFDKALCRTMEEMSAKENGIPISDAKKKFIEILKGLEKRWEWHDYLSHAKKLGINWVVAHKVNFDKLKLLPHTKEILIFTRKKGYINYLVTNAVHDVVVLRTKSMGVISLFDEIIGSDDVKALKSEGKHFEYLIKKSKINVGESFSVGDNPLQDIIPAKRLGLKTIFCRFGRGKTHYHTDHIKDEHKITSDADYTISDLKEIEKIT